MRVIRRTAPKVVNGRVAHQNRDRGVDGYAARFALPGYAAYAAMKGGVFPKRPAPAAAPAARRAAE